MSLAPRVVWSHLQYVLVQRRSLCQISVKSSESRPQVRAINDKGVAEMGTHQAMGGRLWGHIEEAMVRRDGPYHRRKFLERHPSGVSHRYLDLQVLLCPYRSQEHNTMRWDMAEFRVV